MEINRATGATAIHTIASLSTGKIYDKLTLNKALANAIVTASLVPELQFKGIFNSDTLTGVDVASDAMQAVVNATNLWNVEDGLEAALEAVRAMDHESKESLSKAFKTWAETLWQSQIIPMGDECRKKVLDLYKV